MAGLDPAIQFVATSLDARLKAGHGEKIKFVTPAKAGAHLSTTVTSEAGFRLARDISLSLDQGARPE